MYLLLGAVDCCHIMWSDGLLGSPVHFPTTIFGIKLLPGIYGINRAKRRQVTGLGFGYGKTRSTK